MRRRLWPPAGLAPIVIAAVISGCGSSAPVETGTGANRAAVTADKAVTFAKCIRRNGVSQFPDPSGSGKFTIDEVANGSSVNLDTPAFRRALSACHDLEPAGFTGSRWNARQMTGALAFARCIRRNGVTDFPDPVNGQPLIDTNRIPSTASSSGMSALNAAMQTCRSFSPISAGR